GTNADAGCARGFRKRGAVVTAGTKRRQEIDPGEPGKSLRNGHPLRRRKRIGRPAAEGERRRSRSLRRFGKNGRAVGHESGVRLAGTIPFDEGEFGMVERATLPVAENLRELNDALLARRQKFLAGKLGGRAQITGGYFAIR